jgi:uncharacterized protein YkwD
MKKLLLVFPIVFILLLGLWFIKPSPSVKKVIVIPVITVTPTPQPFSEDKLWGLIQDWRVSQGLKTYIIDPRLCNIAEDRVMNYPILDNHVGLSDAIKGYANYPKYVYFAENLAQSYTETMMLDQWITSKKGHLQTLQANYVYSCVECKKSSTTEEYCSQIFSNL